VNAFPLNFDGNRRETTKAILLLAIVALCFFEYTLHHYSSVFCEFEALLLQLQIQLMLFACVAVWCGFFILLTFRLDDLPLIAFLLIAIFIYAASYAAAWPTADAMILLVGATLGRGVRLCLSRFYQYPFISGLIILLTLPSWCHLDMRNNPYHGPRWMGLWDDPNTYGMLMSVGLLLAAGLLAGRQKLPPVILFIAAGIMGVGLFFSYSRGACLGAAIGLLYLAKAHGKFKWRFVLPGIVFTAIVICFFWNSTPDTSQWYMKRMDLSRPSVQHRVAAWKAGFEMMRDHPFGVGWNKAVETYEKDYSPPEDGAAAITTNDYLMMGTQLGLPALLCFIAYIYLKFKPKAADSLQIACRVGTLVLLVAFWFDGGLFDLPTAALFWILLELGSVCRYGEVLHSPPS
jgi:hypothetical protein